MRIMDIDKRGREHAKTIVEHLRTLSNFSTIRPVMVEIAVPDAKPGDLPFRFYGTFSLQRLQDGTMQSRLDLAGTLAHVFVRTTRDGTSKVAFRDADIPDDQVASDWFRACHWDGEVKDCCPVGPWFCLMRWPHERHGRMGEKLDIAMFHVTKLTDL